VNCPLLRGDARGVLIFWSYLTKFYLYLHYHTEQLLSQQKAFQEINRQNQVGLLAMVLIDWLLQKYIIKKPAEKITIFNV